MNEYHKIQTIFQRDMESPGKTLLEGVWSRPDFEYLQNNRWSFTEKVDGTNIRVKFHGGDPDFAGKTDNAQLPAQLVTRLRERFTADRLRSAFDCNACLYGEGYGAKIQGGGKYREDQDFVLFDVKIGDLWLERESVEDIAAKLGLDVVPVIGGGTLWDAVKMARSGFLSRWGDFPAEGIVARPSTELLTRRGERVIAKIKTRDFPRG